MTLSRYYVACGLVCAFVAVCGPASASTYFSQDNPLNAWEDGVSRPTETFTL